MILVTLLASSPDVSTLHRTHRDPIPSCRDDSVWAGPISPSATRAAVMFGCASVFCKNSSAVQLEHAKIWLLLCYWHP